MDSKAFHVGDKVRDKRFNIQIYGEVLCVNDIRGTKHLVIKTNKGNFTVPAYMMEHV